MRNEANDLQRLVALVPKLLREIANTPLRTTVAFVAPLLLLPQFHANTIRLEALLHLVVARGGVSGRLRKTMLADWLNQQVRAGPFAHVEDPPEDVFVGNVSLREGDFKLLLGVYEGADFHVQTLLEVLETARAVLALHSDKADVHRAALEQESKRNGASLATRILAEMAACHSKAAGAAVSRSVFESLIGKVSLIIEFGQYSDAMHGGFIQPSLTVYPSGEVSVESQFFSEVQLPRQRAGFHSQYEGAAARYGALFEPAPEGRTAGDLFGAQYSAAFMDEFEITPETLKAFSQELEQAGIDEDSQSLIMSRQDLAAHMKDVDPTVADRVIARLTLPRRSSWDSVPASDGFRSRDWYPWKYRRQLSLLARPFIQLRDGTLLVSPHQASMAFRYLVMGAFDASLGEEHFKSDAMVRWIGKKRADRGVAFNVSVADQIGEAGFEAKPNVLVKSISGKKGDEVLGDIDALAWSKADNVVAIVECKDLFFAKTAGEAAEQLSNFRGRADKKGRPDELAKHLQRVQWAEVNAIALQRFLKLPNEPKIVDLVVFSRNVPMTYYNGVSGGSSRFCEISDLPGRLSSLFAQR